MFVSRVREGVVNTLGLIPDSEADAFLPVNLHRRAFLATDDRVCLWTWATADTVGSARPQEESPGVHAVNPPSLLRAPWAPRKGVPLTPGWTTTRAECP